MSDLTEFLHGQINAEGFVAKEWGRVETAISGLPVAIQPIAQTLVTDGKVILTDAAEWAGTAVSAIVASETGTIQTAVLNILAGAVGSGTTSAAAQDGIQAVSKLLQAVIADAVVSFQHASAPADPVG